MKNRISHIYADTLDTNWIIRTTSVNTFLKRGVVSKFQPLQKPRRGSTVTSCGRSSS